MRRESELRLSCLRKESEITIKTSTMRKTKNHDGCGPWIDIQKEKPKPNTRILICDEFGYVDIENTQDEEYYKSIGYPSPTLFDNRIPSFEEMWESGNGTKIVAWMPLPDWPERLCQNNADGEQP